MKKVYCVIGLPLSGKSYFCKSLAKQRRYEYVSTGDIARQLMLDQKTKDETIRNDMFPDEEALRTNLIVSINAKPDGIVLVDGLPRSADQVAFMTSNAMWHWFPEVIQIHAGDDVTLMARARSRARDVGDTDMKNFANRLAMAKLNQANVYAALQARSLQWHTILSGDLETMYKQFDRIINK